MFPSLNGVLWKEEMQCYYYANNETSLQLCGKGTEKGQYTA